MSEKKEEKKKIWFTRNDVPHKPLLVVPREKVLTAQVRILNYFCPECGEKISAESEGRLLMAINQHYFKKHHVWYEKVEFSYT